MKDPYEIRILPPAAVNLKRGAGGVLGGKVENNHYEELTVYRTFPFRFDEEYISVRNAKGEELGIIRELAELEQDSREELRRELQYRYFLPRVNRIVSVKFKSDLWLWDLKTHLGPTRLAMRNLQDYVQLHSGGRVILSDISGKRCQITDWRSLDGHSRKWLEDTL